MRFLHCFLFAILISFTSLVSAQTYQSTVDVRVLSSPEAVTINGKRTVYYELYVTSFSKDTIHFNSLEVRAATSSSVLYSIKQEDWNAKASLIGRESKDRSLLAPGQSLIIYIECALPETAVSLSHHLVFSDQNKEKQPVSIDGALVQLSKRTPIVLGAPLKGGPWAAVYNPEWERGHRRVVYTIDGKARIPGRYAIDFILLNEQGHFAKGDDNVIQNWFGYSADVLAVKDGVVLAVKNDFAESATLSDHIESTADKAAGNYISLDLGDHRIAFYEHLKPGSVKVKSGQRVKKGEVIASLGFTGQTTGPHLHFHVADANATLGAEGLPFEFEKFTHLGTYFNFEEFGKTPWTVEKNPNHFFIKEECPAPNSVVRF